MSPAIQLPDLSHSLQGRDLGHLRIVAGLWGVELNAPDAYTGLQRLATALLDHRLVSSMLEALPEPACQALDDLAQNCGLLPWAAFTRRYGEIREMGPGRRDRERPYLAPTSPAEWLWYRALLARAFFDSEAGPEEHAFIPADLLDLIEEARAKSNPASPAAQFGRQATSAEKVHTFPASDRLLDHTVTLLAALRIGEERLLEELPQFRFDAPASPPLTPPVLKQLLKAAGIVDEQGLPHLERTREFLEASRGEAMALLVRAWLESTDFNELRLIPELVCEGDWQNHPAAARRTILDLILRQHSQSGGEGREVGGGAGKAAGPGPFWSLSSFVNAVRQSKPDYQRPAGDYDSWYIRRRGNAEGNGEEREYLRGFEHWDEIDGELIRYLICGPMYWLGLVDLAGPEGSRRNETGKAPKGSAVAAQAAGGRPSEPESAGPEADQKQAEQPRATAFRLSRWANALLDGSAPSGVPVEIEVIYALSDGRLRLPRLAPRAARYQIARFCHWTGRHDGSEEAYRYRLSPTSLERARQGGLRVGHLLSLLRRYARSVPPALARALERWEEHGVEARLEQLTVLRLSSPEMLNTLRTSRAARFLGDPLGPTAVIVKPGAWEKVQAFLAEMGTLAEVNLEGEEATGK